MLTNNYFDILYLTSVNTDAANAPANHVNDSVNALSKISTVELWRAREKLLSVRSLPDRYVERSFFFPSIRGGWRWFEASVANRFLRNGRRHDVIYLRFSPSFKMAKVLERVDSFKVFELNGLEIIRHSAFVHMMDAVDLIFLSTNIMRDRFLNAFPHLENKVRIHSNVGVNSAVFRPLNSEAARMTFGLPLYAKLILHVSGFQRHHDFDTLIRAFEKFRDQWPDSRLVLAGDGPRRAEISELAIGSRVGDAIDFVGMIDQSRLPALISAADLCVNSMTSEKLAEYGNVNAQKTYEYLACEAPAVESYSTELPLPAWAKEHLICTPAGDAICLFAAMSAAVNDRVDNKDKLERGRRYVINNFSWDAVVSNTMAQIADTMKSRASAA